MHVSTALTLGSLLPVLTQAMFTDDLERILVREMDVTGAKRVLVGGGGGRRKHLGKFATLSPL